MSGTFQQGLSNHDLYPSSISNRRVQKVGIETILDWYSKFVEAIFALAKTYHILKKKVGALTKLVEHIIANSGIIFELT